MPSEKDELNRERAEEDEAHSAERTLQGVLLAAPGMQKINEQTREIRRVVFLAKGSAWSGIPSSSLAM